MRIAPVVTVAHIKAEAARRLAETDWMVIRATEGGKAVPGEVTAKRAAIRAASNRLEQSLPPNYRSDEHWR